MRKMVLFFLFFASTCFASDKLEMLISPEDIAIKINEVAQAIDKDFEGEEMTIILVMKGAICVTADLIRNINTPFVLESIKASSYGQNGMVAGELNIAGLDKIAIESKNVLVVDDIFDSGKTMSTIIARIEERKPKNVKSLVLLAKNRERPVTYRPDYVLFETDDQFLVGFGLDYMDHYRGLNGIFVITPEHESH